MDGNGIRSIEDAARSRKVEEVGEKLTEDRWIETFDKIYIDGPISVQVVSAGGEPESVKVEADKAHMPHIVTKVEDGTLSIGTAKGYALDVSGQIQMTVTANYIRECVVSGVANVVVKNSLTPRRLTLKGCGTGRIRMMLNDTSEYVNCNALGGSIELGGTTTEANLTASGSGKIDVSNFRSQKVVADSNLAGRIDLSGTAHEANLTVSGAGKIDASNLRSQDTVVDASWTGQVTTWTERSLRAVASGVSTIRYKGNPRVKRKMSELGTIERL